MTRVVRSILLLTQVLSACASTKSPAPQAPVGHATGGARAPREMEARQSREESAESEAIARQFLGDRRGGARSAGYQWLTAGKAYWVTGASEPGRLVAVVGDGQAPILLTGDIAALKRFLARSEERRVGKECRSRWWRYR